MSDKVFQIQAGALRQAVAIAASPSQARSGIPVLGHLRLRAEAGHLALTGTNMEAWASATVRGEGDLAGTTVSARRLTALLAHLPAEEMVALHHPADTRPLEITAGPVKAKLFTLPVEDFPEAPEWKPEARWRITAGDLDHLLGQCMHAVSIEETRYYLNGIYLHSHTADGAPQLRAAATDGHRLMLANRPAPEGDEPKAVIIPIATVRRLRGLLARVPAEEWVDLAQSFVFLEVKLRGWTLRSKMIDGTFPDYVRVVPKEGGGVPLQVHQPRRFAEAIRTVTAVSEERSKPVKLSNGTGNTLRLTTSDAMEGDVEMEVPEEVAAWASNESHPTAGFQGRYLLDLCRVMQGGFTMRVSSEVHHGVSAGPCRVEAADGDGLGVLMPMRV